jgi:sugar lactone lactonase YvrE
MKKLGIIIFLILLAGVIIIIVVGDFKSTRLDNRSGNQYELDIDEYKVVDPSLITYKETKNYTIQADSVNGIGYSRQKIYLVADRFLQVFDLQGSQVLKVGLPDSPRCLDITKDETIVIGFGDHIGLFSKDGEQIWMTDRINPQSVITAVAAKDQIIFVADAGSRAVHRYHISGRYLDSFEGKTGEADFHGFIIPSANFDLNVNEEGELWVVNPGKHAFENYTDRGELRAFWENSSVKIDGFSGCCNPAHFTFLPDGSFVTSEKGLVRIKIHKPSGEFLSVVAAPEKFKENGKAPDVTADENGNIYALDYDRKIIRMFVLK